MPNEENTFVVANTQPELTADTKIYLKTGVYNDYEMTLGELKELLDSFE